MTLSDEDFDQMISTAMDELPQEYIKNLNNVAITFAENPTPEQLTKQGVRWGQLLLGLYEGIPQTARGAGYMMVLPDKITLFKQPLLEVSPDLAALRQQVKRTLWHEIAHHYGLAHRDIDRLIQ
jgi:predicted Zn-dependent protease with MMP-like domain